MHCMAAIALLHTLSPSVLVVSRQPELSGPALTTSWNCPAGHRPDAGAEQLVGEVTPPSGDMKGAAWGGGSASSLLLHSNAIMSMWC